jgi:retron-type reverse transcriptase
MTSRPSYSHRAIHSPKVLALALGIDETTLVEVARNAGERYRLAKPITKPDGSLRRPFDALEPLKEIHRRIKDRIFSKVIFPDYLTGSLKGRDYRVNAKLHSDARIVICEDIEGFFPSTGSHVVHDIWRGFFGFSEVVADLLTALTTREGELPQGAITSSYLANLAFWRYEPELHDRFEESGIRYSRYVDDITVSARKFLSKADLSQIIAAIYGMLCKQGYRAKRRKHEVFTNRRRMITTKLVINRRPALSLEERAQIRAAVHQLEQRLTGSDIGEDVIADLNSVAGRVGKLKRFHPAKGKALLERVRLLRARIDSSAQ